VVNRIEVPADVRALHVLERVDYADAFAVHTSANLPPERWARLFFDGTSDAFRTAWWWVFGGFRRQSAPSEGPDRIFGWKVLRNTDAEIVLGVDSPLGLTARLVATTPPGHAVISSLLQLDTTAARTIWRVGAYGHRVTARHLLNHAANVAGRDANVSEVDGRER
jgi:hypothetical protein